MSRHDLEDFFPILTMPLWTFVSLAILSHGGREDLAGYALVAALLMTVGQMGVFVGSEIVANEREGGTLELAIASPAPYFTLLITRIIVLTGMGVAGFIEAWLIARLGFGLDLTIHHPAILVTTTVLTILAGAATSLITSALFCFGRTTRTYQNAISGPLYLLGGVLVPVTFLPDFIQPLSRLIYLFWSAELLRDVFRPAGVENAAGRLAALALLGVIGGAVGLGLLGRMLDRLRRDGAMGL